MLLAVDSPRANLFGLVSKRADDDLGFSTPMLTIESNSRILTATPRSQTIIWGFFAAQKEMPKKG